MSGAASDDARDPGADETGRRLAEQGRWLALLFLHLTGRAVRARVEIDDLVQEALLRAWSAPGGLPPEEPGEAALKRFLARIARHCVVDVLRSLRALKRSAREVPLRRADWSATGLGEGRLEAAGPGPATLVLAADEQAALLRAFDGLSPEHRRVLGLRQFEGLSAREAARRMGRSETAVHSLYRRALAAWDEALGGDGTR